MDWKKWIDDHKKEIAEITTALVGLAASLIVASLLPDHDNAND